MKFLVKEIYLFFMMFIAGAYFARLPFLEMLLGVICLLVLVYVTHGGITW